MEAMEFVPRLFHAIRIGRHCKNAITVSGAFQLANPRAAHPGGESPAPANPHFALSGSNGNTLRSGGVTQAVPAAVTQGLRPANAAERQAGRTASRQAGGAALRARHYP